MKASFKTCYATMLQLKIPVYIPPVQSVITDIIQTQPPPQAINQLDNNTLESNNNLLLRPTPVSELKVSVIFYN